MRIFTKPTPRAQRFDAITQAAGELGFAVVSAEKSYALLAPHIAKLEQTVPESDGIGVVGRGDGRARVVTGEFASTDHKGHTGTTDVLLTVLKPRCIQGTAAVERDCKHSTATALRDRPRAARCDMPHARYRRGNDGSRCSARFSEYGARDGG